MKSRRLTETDLANLAFKPVEAKRLRLTSLERPKKIVGSYEPFRRHNGDALNEQYPLLDRDEPDTPLSKLEDVIARACKGDADLLAMNLPIARATHNFVVAQGIRALREVVSKLALPFGHIYEFGMPLLMDYPDGRIVAVFPDLRRTQQLSPVGQRVVFSMMHQRWKENHPDLANIELEIWRYKNTEHRQIAVIACAEQELIGYDELIADVRETYEMWHNVTANATQTRRSGGDDYGPLFGRGA